MDEHTQGEELSFATEGSIVSEEEVREMEKPKVIDYPMPGEVAHPERHEDVTLKQIEGRENKPKAIDCE